MLKQMMARHKQEIEDLRANCNHFEKDLVKKRRGFGVGNYTKIVCCNCGCVRISFGKPFEETACSMEEQSGETSLFTTINNDWEIEKG